ncbi:unnamed protein product [Trichogramma brassicae]|uniref:Peptidase S1 domain-containing protein n=1 Tax=Trichogramma brassicae TaxID=86971 RepID=A0A6H5IIA5_9HYME|nr:unnamed protein product [Trichogramma brassicae]
MSPSQDRNMCIEMSISLCENCLMFADFVDSSGTQKAAATFTNKLSSSNGLPAWRNVKINKTLPRDMDFPVKLLINTLSNTTKNNKPFWAISNIRRCYNSPYNPMINIECPELTYGHECQRKCGRCAYNNCNAATGECKYGCKNTDKQLYLLPYCKFVPSPPQNLSLNIEKDDNSTVKSYCELVPDNKGYAGTNYIKVIRQAHLTEDFQYYLKEEVLIIDSSKMQRRDTSADSIILPRTILKIDSDAIEKSLKETNKQKSSEESEVLDSSEEYCSVSEEDDEEVEDQKNEEVEDKKNEEVEEVEDQKSEEPRRSQRQRKTPYWLSDYKVNFMCDVNDDEPTTYAEAIERYDAAHCVCDKKNRIRSGKLFVVVGATDFTELHEQRIQAQVTKIFLPKKYTNVNPHPGQEFLPKADIAVLKVFVRINFEFPITTIVLQSMYIKRRPRSQLKNALDLEPKEFQLSEALSFGSASSDWVNAMATFAGYGLYDIDWENIKVDAASNEILHYGSTSYNSLHWIKTRVLSNDICRDRYNVPVDPEQVCAIALSDLKDVDAHCTRGICHVSHR